MSRGVRNTLYLAMIVAFIAMPTVLALGYHRVTGDPELRPLAATAERLAEVEGPHSRGQLLVQISLHGRTPPRGGEMAGMFSKAFAARGVRAQVRFVEAGREEAASVLYIVGRNRLGPFPLSRAAEGVDAALAAYHAGRG